MPDLTRLPHQLDPTDSSCRAIIETPKGFRCKYDYDRETGLFELAKMLPEGMAFPLDFGFVPSTVGGDGDPLDVMVLEQQPAPVGALVRVRLLGVMKAEQQKNGPTERNDRLLGVPLVSSRYSRTRALSDLRPSLLESLAEFWLQKAKLEGKSFKVIGWDEAEVAVELVKNGARAATKT